jgi:hypothetical protein
MSDTIARIRSSANKLIDLDSSLSERVQIRVDEGSLLPIFIGRSFPSGTFAAVLRSVSASDLPHNYRRPTIKGLNILWLDSQSKAGGSFDIVMELTRGDAADIFFVFIARLCEVSERCSSVREAVQNTLWQVDLWKEFFAGTDDGALSEGRQTGLFGELTVLRSLIDSGVDVALAFNAWTGSSATNQDFEFGEVAIEVKATVSADSNDVSISNIRQLDTAGIEALYLSRLAFDARQGNERTLVSLVSELRELLASTAPNLQVTFEQKLLNAKYRDQHIDHYANRSLTLRHHHVYRVEEGFPRIEEKDLPAGVSEIKYHVSLHGCESYKEDFPVVVTKVINPNG